AVVAELAALQPQARRSRVSSAQRRRRPSRTCAGGVGGRQMLRRAGQLLRPEETLEVGVHHVLRPFTAGFREESPGGLRIGEQAGCGREQNRDQHKHFGFENHDVPPRPYLKFTVLPDLYTLVAKPALSPCAVKGAYREEIM